MCKKSFKEKCKYYRDNWDEKKYKNDIMVWQRNIRMIRMSIISILRKIRLD
jgi:hypothetical protein